MKTIISAALVSVLSLATSSAMAESPTPASMEPDKGLTSKVQNTENEHRGFFARATFGAGYMSIRSDDNEGEWRGVGADFHITAGFAIVENLILHGDLGVTSMSQPTHEWNGDTTTPDVTVSRLGIGGGLTYFIMPANLYLTGTAMTANVTVTDNEDSEASIGTRTGYGFRAVIGKDWWLRNGFGLGGAVYGTMFTTPSGKDNKGLVDWKELHGYSMGLVFSSSYN